MDARSKRSLRFKLFAEVEGQCPVCRCEMTVESNRSNEENFAALDHIQALFDLDPNEASNIQVMCRQCNIRKGQLCMSNAELRAEVEAIVPARIEAKAERKRRKRERKRQRRKLRDIMFDVVKQSRNPLSVNEILERVGPGIEGAVKLDFEPCYKDVQGVVRSVYQSRLDLVCRCYAGEMLYWVAQKRRQQL